MGKEKNVTNEEKLMDEAFKKAQQEERKAAKQAAQEAKKAEAAAKKAAKQAEKEAKQAEREVAKAAKEAEKEANPEVDDDLITGKVANINDAIILENLKKRLLTVRK